MLLYTISSLYSSITSNNPNLPSPCLILPFLNKEYFSRYNCGFDMIAIALKRQANLILGNPPAELPVKTIFLYFFTRTNICK